MKPDYSDEPQRRDDFTINAQEPFNAEPSARHVLPNKFFTRNDAFLVRNHGPVPQLSFDTLITLENTLRPDVVTNKFTVGYLKSNFSEYAISSTIMCAGNRRNEMKSVKPVKGVGWNSLAISNALWSGVRLKDVIDHFHPEIGSLSDVEKPNFHVEVEGHDISPDEKTRRLGYTASIPLYKALSDEVLLAWGMNGETLPQDHGFPLRLIVPGWIGARSVKWVKRITLQAFESRSFYQARDYKVFHASVDWPNITSKIWDSAPAITSLSVQSAILDPAPGQPVVVKRPLVVQGYAVSGNGQGIQRVEVSCDDGTTWECAELLQRPPRVRGTLMGADFSWVMWRKEFRLPSDQPQRTVLRCRAIDTACNSQPNTVGDIWNLRGVMNNAVCRVEINVRPSATL